jgi:hypothetical protein
MKRCILFFGLFVFVQTIKCQTTYTWKGTLSTSWNNSGNWSPVGVPGATDNIKIVTAPNICMLPANTSINNITLTSGTLDLGGFTLTGATGDSAIFTTGTVQNGGIVLPAANYTIFGAGPVTMNCVVNITSATVTFRNTAFQNVTTITKNGTTNDASSGGNVFNNTFTFTNAGSGYELIGNTNPDVFNAAATFNNTGSNNLYVAYNSANNIFNGVTTFNNNPTTNNQILVSQNSAGTVFNNNIVVSSVSGAGVQFNGNASTNSALASGMTISIGPAGFSAGTLLVQEFTQVGATPQSFTLTGTAVLTFGVGNTFNGNVTASSPTVFLNGTTFNGTTNLTKTGTTGDYNSGGNIFNGVSSITNSGSSFWLLGNSNPDIWNNDVTFTDNGSERMLPCWGTAGNQFNGNITVNTSGSAQGIQFCGGNATATATLAATKTIQAGTVGLTAGYLYLKQFTQLGNVPISLLATGSSVLYLGPSSNFGGVVTVTAPDIWAQGATYNSAVTFTKTGGSSNHNNQNQNIFNSTCTINQQSGSGYFMLGYNSNDQFNDNISLTSSGAGGIYLGWTSGTGTPTLAAGKTIQVGPAGFSAGFLYLNTFTQLGNANMNLTFTGTNTYFAIARSSVIGGALTLSTPDLYFNGATLNGTLNATKSGAGNDYSTGGNTFQGSATFNATGTGNIVLANNTADIWNNTASFNNSGASVIAVAWSSAGNMFNGNITVSSTGLATGVQFCGGNATATATLASGDSIAIGSAGFSSGTLLLRQFTQLGNTSTSLSLTGPTTLVQVGPSSAFGGDFTVISPRILLNGAVFSDTVNLTKTGATGEWSAGGNTFNSTLYVNQQGGGYFGFANGSPDIYNGDVYANNNSTERIIFGNSPVGNQFNGNIILTQTGSSQGIAFGWSATTNETQAAGKTISIGAAGFNTGYLQIERFAQLGNAPMNLPLTGTSSLTFGPNSSIGGNMTSTSASLLLNGCTFSGRVNSIKNGPTNDFSSGANIFNDTTTITDAGSGYIALGNTNQDQFNSVSTFNNTGSANMYVANNSANNVFGGTATFNNSPTANTLVYVSQYSAGTVFNGNVVVSSTNGQGVQFCTGNATATVTLSAGDTLSTGAAGFSAGTLMLRQFTQLGNAPTNLTLTGATTLLQTGPSSAFGGDFTVVSPRILLNGAVFSDTVNLTKTGATGEWSVGGNTFNSTLYVNQLSGGYFGFANGLPDIYNGDVYANNNSTERIIFGNNPVGNQYNGNIILTQIGSSQGIAFGWSATTNETQAAGKTISIGATGFNTGYLQIERFTQLGNAPMNLPLTGTASLTFGPNSAIGGNMTSTSSSLYFNGCTFSGDVNSTKTGSTNDYSSGNNIFNDSATITNAGSGFLLFGNGNADQFNSVSIFNNTGSSSIYVAYNSPNNIFGGTAIFNNTPTANTPIYVSQFSAGTIFNGNIVVTSTNGQGILFCNGNTTASATLSSGNTISIGSGGFSAGTLLLRQFTQSGPTTQGLTLTGTSNLTFGPSSAFGGNVTTVSPTLLFNGCIFNGTVTSAKNGTSSDASSGNNVFNSPFTVTNTGAGYLMMGNGNPDLWQSTAVFNNFSTAQHMYIAYNSTGNTFNGDVTFNNQPGSTGLWIYSNYYGVNTQYNGNIIAENVNGGGIYFGPGTGTATLAGSGSVNIGPAGFNSGSLVFKSFAQSNSASAQNMTTTGTSTIQYGPAATFNGTLTSSSPGLLFNGGVFNGVVNCTKTGTSNDPSAGGNTFNGVSTLTDNGTGYLLMGSSGADTYNGNISFVQSNSTGKIYPNYNINSFYAGNLTITSPTATAITFGANTGTATFSGSGVAGQTITATAGTATPVFTRLVIGNTGGGVTLSNTNISVSNSLSFSSGLLYTTTSALLTMLNGSATAAGDATSTSYVCGPMQYQKSTSGISTLNFPIGDSTESRPFILTVNHTNGTLYTYQALLFKASAQALNYTLPLTVDHVSQVHYYTINRTAAGVSAPTAGLSGNQTIQIFFGADDFVSNGGTLTICKNVFTAPSNWIDIGGMNGPTYSAGANLTGSITSTSSPSVFNSFSTFSLADKINGGNVLPVGLVDFKAIADNSHVDLQWTTTSESNNSYFTIEKSQDASSFNFVAKVATEAPNGNSSSPLNYAAQDRSPYSGVSYYRLKQTDLDGNNKYSAVVAVNFVIKQSLMIYPNPTKGSLYVTGLDINATSLIVQWFDLTGKMLQQSSVAAQGGMASLNTNFNNGMYLLKLISPDGSFTVQNIIILK